MHDYLSKMLILPTRDSTSMSATSSCILGGKGNKTYLPQNHQSLKVTRQTQILLILQLGPLPIRQQHRRTLRLPPRNGLRPARLPHHIDRLPHPHIHLQRLQLLVQRDEEARVHGCDDEVEEVVGVGEDEGFGVDHGDEDG